MCATQEMLEQTQPQWNFLSLLLRELATHLITHMANSVLEHETGKQINYGQLRKHTRLQETLKTSFSNVMVRLCQGVGKGPNGEGKIIEGTNTFFAIKFEKIPKDRLNEICYTSVVCEVRPGGKVPNRTRITICGTKVCYPGDVGTNIATLELFKLMINSVLSRKGAKYVCFDIENVYLSTPLGRPEYVKIKLSKFPEEFIKEYNLTTVVHKGWVYFEIICGCHGLPQSGMLANKQLRERLEKEGYYEARTTLGLWRHKWRPIQLCLVLDNFGVEYVGKQHSEHLATILKNIIISQKIDNARSMLELI